MIRKYCILLALALTPLPAADIAMLLLQNSFNHFIDPQGAMSLSASVASSASAWRLQYDEPEMVPQMLQAQLATTEPIH